MSTLLQRFWIVSAASFCLRIDFLTERPLKNACIVRIAFFFSKNSFRIIIVLHHDWMKATDDVIFLSSSRRLNLFNSFLAKNPLANFCMTTVAAAYLSTLRRWRNTRTCFCSTRAAAVCTWTRDNLNSDFRERHLTFNNATSSALFIEFYFFNDQSSGQMQ